MLVNDICILQTADYENARDKLETISKSLPGYLSFGQFGVVGQPSISDLDIFICFEDESAQSNFEIIEAEIKGDKKLKYIYTHSPLILPKSVLPLAPYLHSLYNLNLSDMKNDLLDIIKLNKDYIHQLNLIWIVFLLPISIKIIRYPEKFGFRFSLLVLKNLHQALENIKPNQESTNNYLDKSEYIRSLAVESKLSSDEILNEYKIALSNLMKFMTGVKKQRQTAFKKGVLKFPKRYKLVFSENCKYDYNNHELSLYMNESFYEIVYGLMGYKTNNENLNLYIKNSKMAFSIFCKLKMAYPFIKPFGIPYYKNDFISKFKFYIKTIFEQRDIIKPVIFESIH